ncbi:G-protein coupled receptors family 1 profile domain-containing protein [Caenorhabditis elegans]|uniref:G-protein coupled receptors family 1 profile domain-containing protein n=1 Tax=Caenorhabditis elegans TaxID=6239 RepID=A0A486WU00_CAEEL|nr:G-protein coupled receptors family 1 profile domain-containing protein [Caenorhabditis elegans]VGM69588.1 G-protein coupled receptors family 1 profile domain-containing protein [Caenorhabditis elegans]
MLLSVSNGTDQNPQDLNDLQWNAFHAFLLLLIILVVFGNTMVIFAVAVDRKLRSVTTNKFIASLAVSDLLVGLIVMPLSLYYKMHNDHWTLGYTWCQFHLVSGVFSTTASIVHLVAISLDRYFAIMFPTEYQRHSVSTSTVPYVVMIWLMALAVSSTLFMEQRDSFDGICWISNPQYIVLSSFLSFFLPGAIVVYLYMKIFKKLRNHQLYMFGQLTHRGGERERRHSLPRVIIEEVRSRRGSRMSQTGSQSGSPTRRQSGGSKERSPSQPDIHIVAKPQQRWRSPTICAETLAHDRLLAAKKRVSIVPDPPSMDVSVNMASIDQMKDEHHHNLMREEELLGCEAGRRKQSEEEVRKLSDERKRVIYERRRSSTSENPNGIPIMQAFQKAYQEVRAGRRRSTIHDTYHFPSLTTVNEPATPPPGEDCEEKEKDSDGTSIMHKLSSGSSIAETVIAMLPKTSTLSKTDSHESSVSTEASQKPLLGPPTHHYTKKSQTQKEPRYSPSIPAPTFLMVPAMMAVNTPPATPNTKEAPTNCTSLLQVPRLFDCPSPCSVPSNSSHSSYTSASGSSDTYRRISMNSYGSSLTDGTESTFECDSRRSSAWSTIRAAVFDRQQMRGGKASVDITVDRTGSPQKKMSTISRGKLRRIATQVTRAIRRKRRESMAIRRESRATRVVAAILIAFLICWIPYFCISIFRGVLMGFQININTPIHLTLFVYTSWLGYAHSCFNPLIYMCLNKNFRNTMRKMMQKTNRAKMAEQEG